MLFLGRKIGLNYQIQLQLLNKLSVSLHSDYLGTVNKQDILKNSFKLILCWN